MEDQVSLNKYISSTGFCSRREADELIAQGRVTINGKTARSGARVGIGDNVEIDGEPTKKSKKQETLYLAFNKPVGVTSTTDTKDRTNIISYINHPKRIFPVGRLDKDSDGLILLTNDGDIVNKILRAGNYHEKEYIVMVDKPIDADFVQQMSDGVPVLGQITQKCVVRQESQKRFRITLTQGLNRQIRRMCQHLGYKVVSLTRIRIMNIRLEKLGVGAWRQLTPQEVTDMNRMIASSSKTEEASVKTERKKAPLKHTPAKKTTTSTDRKAKPNAAAPKKEQGKKSAKPSAEKSRKPAKAVEKKGTKSSKATPEKTGSKKGSYKEWRNRK